MDKQFDMGAVLAALGVELKGVELNPDVSEGTRGANARIEDAVGRLTDALRAKHAKHSFKPRVELRFMIDDRYLTRTALSYEMLAHVLSRADDGTDLAVQFFAEDVAEYGRESALRKVAARGTRRIMDEIISRPIRTGLTIHEASVAYVRKKKLELKGRKHENRKGR